MPAVSIPKEFARVFREVVRRGRRFLVASHLRPDGDAYGSTLALALALQRAGKESVAWNPDGMSERFAWLPGAATLKGAALPAGPWDARIVVDTASSERVGGLSLAPDASSPIVNVDHHGSNPRFGDLVWVDPARASCGEMILELIRAADLPLDHEVASCLFVAISTDTGSFRYSNTRPATLRAAAELLETGIDLANLSRMTWENEPARRLALVREVLQTSRFEADGEVGVLWIKPEAYARSGALPEDTEGLIDFIRGVRGVRVALVFEEVVADGVVRVSFRSKDPSVDVAKIALKFGGGGHAAAAGARVPGKAAAVEQAVLAAVDAAL